MKKQSRISIHPEICSGKPCITGTRILVRNILSLLATGYSQSQVLETYPELKQEDIQAAIQYAIDLTDDIQELSA